MVGILVLSLCLQQTPLTASLAVLPIRSVIMAESSPLLVINML